MPFAIDLKSELGISANPLVRCACGREVNADMMRDVRPIAHLTDWPETHRCDSCVEHLHRTEKVSRGEFYKAHKAPRHLIDFHEKRDKAVRDAGKQ